MFWVYVVENAMTVVAALILSPTFGVPGLAVAWVGPYTVASLYAVVRLKPRVGSLGGWLTIRALIRILVASAVTAAVVFGLGVVFPSGPGDGLVIAKLLVQVGVGGGVYIYLARALGIRELRPVMAVAGRLLGR